MMTAAERATSTRSAALPLRPADYHEVLRTTAEQIYLGRWGRHRLPQAPGRPDWTAELAVNWG